MAYAIKLIDSILQLLVLAGGFVLLSAFGLIGYFYWSVALLCVWIVPSMLIHIVFRLPLSIFRWVFIGLVSLILLVYGISFVSGVTFAELNFYFYPTALPIVLFHLVLNLSESIQHRKGGEKYTNF